MRTMMRGVTAGALAGVMGLGLALGGCGSGGKGETMPDGRVQKRGFLEQSVAVGGEGTGWSIVTGREGDRRDWLDVDVSKVQAAAERLKTKKVVVVGTMSERSYVTRGKVMTLEADSIVWDEEPRAAREGLPPPPGPARK